MRTANGVKSSSSTIENNNQLAELVYVSDQLAHFPYKVQDEVNYLAHIVDLQVSTLGSAVVRALHDCLTSSNRSDEAYNRKVSFLLSAFNLFDEHR